MKKSYYIFFLLLFTVACTTEVPKPTYGGVLGSSDYVFDINALPEITITVPLAEWNLLLENFDINSNNDEKVVAAIVGAVVAMGYSLEQIASIRPTATSAQWRLDGRLSGRN